MNDQIATNGSGKASVKEVYDAIATLRAELKVDLNRIYDLNDQSKTDVARLEAELARVRGQLSIVSGMALLSIPALLTALMTVVLP